MRKWGTPGREYGQLEDPRDVAIDRERLVYLVDGEGSRAQVFSSGGAYVDQWSLLRPAGSLYLGAALDLDGAFYVAQLFSGHVEAYVL